MYPDYTHIARFYMRDSSYDDDWPEKYLSPDLLEKLHSKKSWREGDWFWGWERLQANRTSSGEPKIQVANISWGLGYHTNKYWMPNRQEYVDENI